MSRTVDVTPTWTGILPLLLIAYCEGTDKGRSAALAELRNMAKAADLFNELTSAEDKPQEPT